MKLKIFRYSCEKIKIKRWKELISALVMCGYEVYADEDYIVFKLGVDDIVEGASND